MNKANDPVINLVLYSFQIKKKKKRKLYLKSSYTEHVCQHLRTLMLVISDDSYFRLSFQNPAEQNVNVSLDHCLKRTLNRY